MECSTSRRSFTATVHVRRTTDGRVAYSPFVRHSPSPSNSCHSPKYLIPVRALFHGCSTFALTWRAPRHNIRNNAGTTEESDGKEPQGESKSKSKSRSMVNYLSS